MRIQGIALTRELLKAGQAKSKGLSGVRVEVEAF